MLLPMMAFQVFLIVIGGLFSLVCVADPDHERSSPRVGFPIFFAGLFSFVLSWSLEALVETLSSGHSPDGVGFLTGYLVGIIGGVLLGLRLARKHQKHLMDSAIDKETHENES